MNPTFNTLFIITANIKDLFKILEEKSSQAGHEKTKWEVVMDMWGGPGLGGRDGDTVWSRAGRMRWRCSMVQGWEVVMDMWCGPGLGGRDGYVVWSRAGRTRWRCSVV